jgi:hypothetical protein
MKRKRPLAGPREERARYLACEDIALMIEHDVEGLGLSPLRQQHVTALSDHVVGHGPPERTADVQIKRNGVYQ